MPKLKMMKVKAVALVDKGANRREFFLVKSNKGGSVNKELVIEILKSAKGLSQERVNELIALVPEAERAEVLAVAKAADGVDSNDSLEIEQLVEKIGEKFSKATGDQLKVLQEHFGAMQKILEELVNGLKDGGAEADPANPAADASGDEIVKLTCACGEKVEKAADGATTCPKCGAEVLPVAKSDKGNADPEVSAEEFTKSLDDALKSAVPV